MSGAIGHSRSRLPRGGGSQESTASRSCLLTPDSDLLSTDNPVCYPNGPGPARQAGPTERPTYRKMKIYTKTGDSGETGLVGGERVLKNSPRLEVCGTYDELNAMLGLARTAASLPKDVDQLIDQFQNDLFNAGSEIATAPPGDPRCPAIGQEHIRRIEEAIDRFEVTLPPLCGFILPRGCQAAALLHVARTICRRAERRLVALQQIEPGAISAFQLVYLNRLGDLFFVLARVANQQAGVPDSPWRKTAPDA
jgi:cob(I)alamin adenosyltransferase